jgi:hypothetical protein
MATKRKRRRRRSDAPRKSGGALMGLRAGFKRAAQGAAGSPQPAGRSSWFGTALTIVLVVAAIAFFLRRFA